MSAKRPGERVLAATISAMTSIKDTLEERQVFIYFAAVGVAVAVAMVVPGTTALESAINPALALMLYVTFLQVPLADLSRSLANGRFLAALLVANFAVPLLVAGMLALMPADPVLRFGMLLVLLAPCIDYVVTFSHLGRADAKLLLAATPSLLVVQMVMLPVYLRLLLDADAAALVQPEPFIDAFVWLIAVPLVLAGVTQVWANRSSVGKKASNALGLVPVPATALVLFTVVAAVLPQLASARGAVTSALPFYVAFAVIAPLVGWAVARAFRLETTAGRAVAFSAGTRNSLVVLPLALSVPGAIPVLPAIIVAQTLVELVGELVYVRWIARFGTPPAKAGAAAR